MNQLIDIVLKSLKIILMILTIGVVVGALGLNRCWRAAVFQMVQFLRAGKAASNGLGHFGVYRASS